MNRRLLVFGTLVIVIVGFILAAKMPKQNRQQKPVALGSANLVNSENPSLGNPQAKVTLVEFLDPECESCASFYPIVKRILKEYPNDVRLTVRYMMNHGNSESAVLACEAARKQGKYWEMLEMLFMRPHQWSHKQVSQVTQFTEFAKELGLNTDQFMRDLLDPEVRKKVVEDFKNGMAIGIKGTPTIFVNESQLLTLSYKDLRELVETELNK